MCKPYIAVPIGDPAGVGPEIVAKAVASKEAFDVAKTVVIGDKKVMEQAIRISGVDLKINVINEPEDGDYSEGVLNLIDLDNINIEEFEFGKVNGKCGQAAFAYIAKSIELANTGKVDAVATTPINKESLRAGDINFIGHTEIFGELTNTDDPLTMFETNGMRIFFLTRHVSLRDMLDLIKKDRIKDYVKRCLIALEKLGVKDGAMAIAGLNPHSGEHGLFGWEEVNEVTPAIEELQAELASKNIRIAELDDAVVGLSQDVDDLTAQNEAKAATLSSQDKALNTAWFVFGTKSELKDQNIIQKGDVLKNANFNKDYFTQIDIRTDKEIKLYAKKAELLILQVLMNL